MQGRCEHTAEVSGLLHRCRRFGHIHRIIIGGRVSSHPARIARRAWIANAVPVFSLLSFCWAASAWAQSERDPYRDKLQPVLEHLIRQQELPGLAIAVVKDNRVVYAAGFGVKDIRRKNDLITTQSVFHMASITKPFVATSIMQLVEKGKIDLDSPVVKYLPYFQMSDERYRTVTVRQMVTHSSGLPDVEDYKWGQPEYDEGALERYVRSLSNLKLLFAPGEKFAYSNMAFEVLGDLIAKVSGESFENYVQHHILLPLGMKNSTLLVKDVEPGVLAWGHVLDDNGGPVPSKVYPYNRSHSPSSNLHSNVLDMARWTIANMNRGELDGIRILTDSSYDVMWKPAGQFAGKPSPAGISWFLEQYRGNMKVGHDGGDDGFLADLAMLPEKKIAVVWMTNADWLPDIEPVTRAALDVALGEEPKEITTKRPIDAVIASTYEKRGIDAAIRQYETLKKLRPAAYNFSAGQLNNVGRYLLRKGQPRDAIHILELNAAAHPSSANIFDALGEAYERDGNTDAAIRSYSKAIQLDPNLTHSTRALNRLKN